eukprot:TRINITY_DN978_c0_g1_i3.p1 TRINITY_DN978_c0_g1~~TRINITY_DN978_c0_g1_i3.p1  ORF type:complete len:709 (-),score=262.30 TRINITY_DN978_c0_g1_i3:15-2141(-)
MSNPWEEDVRTPEQIQRTANLKATLSTPKAEEKSTTESSSPTPARKEESTSSNSTPAKQSAPAQDSSANPWDLPSGGSSNITPKSSTSNPAPSTSSRSSAPVHDNSANPWDLPAPSSSNTPSRSAAPVHDNSANPWDLPSSSSSSTPSRPSTSSSSSNSTSSPSTSRSSAPVHENSANPWDLPSSSSSSTPSKPSTSSTSSSSSSSASTPSRSAPVHDTNDDPWGLPSSSSSSNPWTPSFASNTEKEDVEDKTAAYQNRGVYKNEEIAVTPLVAEGEKSATPQQREQAKKDLTDIFRAAAHSFDDLGLSPELLKGVTAMGWTRPSKIQELTLPMMCNSEKYGRKHIIAQAQTGTGKTGAFSLGAISRVNANENYPQVFCVSPTRELAQQTFTVIRQLSQFTKIETLLCVPDAILPADITQHVVVGTPGSLKGLISRRRIDAKKLKVFVLDEADQLLTIEQSAGSQGGLGQISLEMRKALSPECSIMLFSATYEEEVAMFATKVVPKEGRVSIRLKPEEISLDKITQFYIQVPNYMSKFNKVSELFNFMTVGQTIIFLERRVTAKKLFDQLVSEGHKVSLLHGKDMETMLRDKVMDSFRKGETKVLITTNVLARGIDVSQVTLVVNFDLPSRYTGAGVEADRSTYLHRIGRSSRFGRAGVAINLIHDDNGLVVLKDFEKFWGKEITPFPEDLQELDNILKQVVEGNQGK